MRSLESSQILELTQQLSSDRILLWKGDTLERTIRMLSVNGKLPSCTGMNPGVANFTRGYLKDISFIELTRALIST